MAIRGPHGGPRVPETPAGVRKDQPASPLQRLMEFGAARTPQEARRIVNDLLAALRAAGFPIPKTGAPDQQLKAALEQFQHQHGLPADGQLDRSTLERLVDGGHVPQPREPSLDGPTTTVRGPAAPQPQEKAPAELDKLKTFLGGELGLPKGGDAPTDARSPKSTELNEKARAAAQEQPPQVDLKSFVASLRSAGFSGAGKGAEQLKDALKKVQAQEGLPQTGHIDARTAEALVKRGVLTEAQARDLVPATPQAELAQPPLERARTVQESATQEATARGAPEPGDAAAPVGRDGAEGQAVRAGEGGDGGARSAGEGSGGVDGDASAGELSPGNAPSGDDRVDDEARGHASVDDGSDAAEGHYEVASLHEQVTAGLLAIARDDGGRGAATYAWDFTLLRPGIYGKRQAAERLFHVVVTRAGTFDPLWERARAAINAKLDALEPDAPRLAQEDVASALRRARVR